MKRSTPVPRAGVEPYPEVHRLDGLWLAFGLVCLIAANYLIARMLGR